MTPDQARIVLLESELRQAQSTVEFLHGCLTSTHYRYAYPDQTLDRLKEWEELAPRDEFCAHSVEKPGCVACQKGRERRKQIYEAKEILGLNKPKDGE